MWGLSPKIDNKLLLQVVTCLRKTTYDSETLEDVPYDSVLDFSFFSSKFIKNGHFSCPKDELILKSAPG